MLTYSFEGINKPLYLHLYQCIRQDILSGVLPSNSRLPSKRSFAKHLGISVITVENAYAQLQSEGFLYSLPKKGFFVSPIETAAVAAPTQTAPKAAAPVHQPASPAIQLSFASNRTAAENFPFPLWAKLTRETLSEHREELMEPSPAGGLPELRTAIAQHLKQFRNMDVWPEQIIVGAGTEYLYSLLIQLLGFDKVYAVENPGYQKIPRIYQSHGVNVQYISLDAGGMSIQQLEEKGADIAHISPSHHYPTGIVTPIGRRYELLAWAAGAPSRYIIEDDYDSEFRLSGKPIPTLQSIDQGGRVIYMNTFTKTLSSTIRISYMVLPPALLEKFDRSLGFYACTVSNFEQHTLARFIQEGHFERHINRMRNRYREIRDGLMAAIHESEFEPQVVRITGLDSGLHFLLKLDTQLSDEALLKKAEQAQLRLSCLSQYYLTEELEPPQHILLINYSGLAPEEIPQAIRLLEQCLS
jgi:GntR family transcriptional regulator/MocR family aminotransferase